MRSPSGELVAFSRGFVERRAGSVRRLFDTAAIRLGLSVADARDILWSLTCGELYRLLVVHRKWTASD